MISFCLILVAQILIQNVIEDFCIGPDAQFLCQESEREKALKHVKTYWNDVPLEIVT